MPEARRAYESIIGYDKNARVTYEEIEKMYFKDALLSPLRKAADGIGFLLLSAKLAFDPDGYALYAFYSGKPALFRPEGLICVRMYLMPFTGEEAYAYDTLSEKGEITLSAFREAVERAETGMKKGLKPENGFEPYTGAFEDVFLTEKSAFLSESAVKAAFALEKPGEISPPVLDARGILIIRLVSSG